MEDFNTDESLVGDSGNDNPRTKKVKAPPATTAPPTEEFQPRQKGQKFDSFDLDSPKNEFSSEELGIKTADFDNYGNIYKGQDIQKMRAEYQSNWDRLGNLGMRVGSNIIGGTIGSLGSVPAVAEGIVDELKGKDADFSNSVMEFGEGIKEWARNNFPNYRENPNESWNVSDPAFWFEGVETAFSALEFMAGAYGAVKGLGAVSKLLKAERALAKAGINAKAVGFGAKVAAGAGFSRNAENMVESMQLVKDTKEQLLSEWEQDPEKFEELKNSQIAKEINGEVTPESLAKHIAGKAGWEAYRTNSINIVFDALQFAPLVKGFNPSTRLGRMATSSGIRAENAAVGGAVKAASPMAKVFDVLNPMIGGIGRSLTEGVEEGINYMGTHRGKNLVNRITGKEEEDIDAGEMSEAAFWGVFGGMAHEGVSRIANKNQNNTETEARIGEIQNRMNIMKGASERMAQITNDPNLPDEIKKDHVNAVKAELALDLGLRAAQAGNVDLLLQQMESKEFADKFVEMGLTEPGEAEKAIAKTKSDVILAEQLYKDYYNTFQFVEGTDRAKNELIGKSIVADFFVRKNVEKRNQVAKELEHLKANDVYVSTNPSTNINTLIELEGLFAARRELNKVINRSKKEEGLLSERGRLELENINKRILQIKEQVKGERVNKEEINPRIIGKQAEIILMDSQNNLQKQFIKENTKPEAVTKQENVIQERQKNADKTKEEEMLDTVKDIIETDSQLTVPKLQQYLMAYRDYPTVQKYITERLNTLKQQEQKKTRQDNVKTEQDPLKYNPEGKQVHPLVKDVENGEGFKKILQEYGFEKELGFLAPAFDKYQIKVGHGKTETQIAELRKYLDSRGLDLNIVLNKKELSNIENQKRVGEKTLKAYQLHTLAHESIHALIAGKINEKEGLDGDAMESSPFYKQLKDLYTPVKKYIQDAQSGNKEAAKFFQDNFSEDELDRIATVINYIDKTSIEEYATLGLTDPTFSKLLKMLKGNTKFPDKESVWSKLAKLVSEFLGLEYSKFNDLVNLLTELDNQRQEEAKPVENSLYDTLLSKHEEKGGLNEPTKSSSEFGGLGDYEIQGYSETSVDPFHKQDIDNLIANKDYNNLEGYLGDYMLKSGKPNDKAAVMYARTKFKEHKEAIQKAKESKELNSELPVGETAGMEFNEFIDHESMSSNKTIEDLEKQPEEEEDIEAKKADIEKRRQAELKESFEKLRLQDIKTFVGNSESLDDTKKGLLEEISTFTDLSELQRKILETHVELVFRPDGHSNPFILDDIGEYKSYRGTPVEGFLEYHFPGLTKEQYFDALNREVAPLLDDIFLAHKIALLGEEEGESGLPENMVELNAKKINAKYDAELEALNKGEEGDKVFEFLAKDITQEVCTVTFPIFRRFGKEGEGHQEYYQTKKGNIVVQDKYVELIRTLMNPEFTTGAEVEVVWDTTETKDEDKGDIYNEAFKIVYKGQTIAWLGRVKSIDIAIKELIKQGKTNTANKVAFDLMQIKKLRKKLSLTNKPFKTKIAMKGNGTIISRGTGPTALRSIKGIVENPQFYALNTNSYRDRTTLVNLEKEADRISNDNPLKPGKVYLAIPDANGKSIPTPVSVAKVNKIQAAEVAENTKKLLDALNRGKRIESEEVTSLRDQVSKYIKVDRAGDFDKYNSEGKLVSKGKPIGYRTIPQSVREDGTTRDARIVVSYRDKADVLKTAVIKKSIYTGEMWMGIYKEGETKSYYEITSADQDFEKALKDLFTLKYHNIDFARLNEKKAAAFEYNGKVYKNYKEYLIEEEIVKTDVAQVVDKSGKVISNLFGFNNDFKMTIEINPESQSIESEEEAQFVKDINDKQHKRAIELGDLFLLDGFESEMTLQKALTDDLSYREKYELYRTNASSSEELLKEIIANPTTPNTKRVAQWLLKNSDKFKVNITTADLKARKAAAVYSVDRNYIAVNRDLKFSETYFQQSILHELLHGVTLNTIVRSFVNTVDTTQLFKRSNGVIDITDVKFKKDTPDYVKTFVEEMVSLRNDVIDRLSKKYGKTAEELSQNTRTFYGLENPFEFISEAMVNPNFRNELRKISEKDSILKQIWDSIIELLNKYFGTKLKTDQKDLLKKSVNSIRNFVDTATKEDLIPFQESEINLIADSRMIDEYDGNFSREEIIEVIQTLEGFISNAVRRGKIDTQEGFEDRDITIKIREAIRSKWQEYYTDKAPEDTKVKVGKIIDYFDTFYNKAISKVNKHFKIGTAYDINLLNENEGLTKDWDDTKVQQISSQDSVTRQIKMFVMSIPEIDNLEHKLDDKGVPIWNRKKSATTGIARYVDFNVVYPYMIRNLIGARSRAEIITRLENMGKVNPSFSYMAYELQKDENLIAQFESNLARKTVYDSYVTFISNLDNKREVWIKDEIKTSRYDYMIADSWVESVNRKVDSLSTAEAKQQFKLAIDKIYLGLFESTKDLEKNRELITDQIYQFSSQLGLDLSIPAIRSVVESARTVGDIQSSLMDTLDLISRSIEKGRKNDDFARLNSIARIEALYRFDVIENSGLDIQGNLIYAIRNPSYISNWFNDLKSNTAEGRENLERTLIGMTKVPEMQFSNWLWNTKSSPGLVNSDIVDGIRVPKMTVNNTLDINWDFVKQFNFHDFGGAKEVISKEAQKYSQFSDGDWRLMNLFAYLNLNDKNERERYKEKDFVYIPSIIASDSGKSGLFEVAKIKLKKTDIYRSGGVLKIKQDSEIFKAVLNVAKGEVRRIQQVTQQLYNIVDGKLVVKKDIDFKNLQQYYHYDKIIRNEDGTINWEKTLLTEEGNPTGKAMYFNNMNIKRDGKIITLDDIDIKTGGYIVPGEVDAATRGKIIKFVEDFISQKIEQGQKDYASLKEEVEDKHENVVDGSYEGLIAEFVMNHYIHNHEQFLFFNGTIAEYKNKIDTNKRAKQLFTPGVALSLEAMKIVYQNGTQGDGQTFRAITIADITTTSNTIDFIVDTVKRGLIKERHYSKADIKGFTTDKAKVKDADKKSTNALVRDTHKIIKGYLAINAGDAQGYISLDRFEALKRGRGEYNDRVKNAVERARRGEMITLDDALALQPVKGFHYQRDYDAANNKMTSTQIKYSTIPLIPAMVKGTELEKIMDYMNKNAIDEVFFESAHKVGAKTIYKIDNPDGTINQKALNGVTPNVYLNRDYKIQLDTPEHLLDEENLLAVQISKLIIANLDPNTKYVVNGKEMSASQLMKHYMTIWSDNIEESAINLLKDLGVEITPTGYIVHDKNIQEILKEEVEKRGLSDNYSYAIELDERGQFKLPLFINNMATKWEAILTSLFTNRVTKQKLGGGSVVLGSRLFLDSAVEQSEANITGIKWSKEKATDRKLKSFFTEDGKTKVVEVLMGGWSKHLYKEGKLMDIDEVPDEIKTMIGYRIPTTSKSYMTVFKVVGLLPEEAKGVIVTPDDMVTQMGQDFDIDKWFLINKEFRRTKKGKFVVPKYGTKEEFESLQEDAKELTSLMNYESGAKTELDVAAKKLMDDIFQGQGDIQDLAKELEEVQEKLKEFGKYNKEGVFEFNPQAESKAARNNEIFEIYKAILTNPSHFKEMLTPSGYPNITQVSDRLDEIFGNDDKNIEPLTEAGQRSFRSRNIVGKDLLGISANFNGFMAVAQVTKMHLNHNIAYQQKVDLSKYNLKELKARYGKNIKVNKDKKTAVITLMNLGHAPDGSYQNIDGELIMEVGAEAVNAAADNAKDPRLAKLNLSTYTYPAYHAGVSVGATPKFMGFFMRQPIIKMLNDYYFENKSILADETGRQIETVKTTYQTLLLKELIAADPQYQSKVMKALNEKQAALTASKAGASEKKVKDINKKIEATAKKKEKIEAAFKDYDRKKKLREKHGVGIGLDTRYSLFMKREVTEEVLGYNPNELEAFSVEELEEQLQLRAKGSMTNQEKIDYYRAQLRVLEFFNRWKKAGEGLSDIAKVAKTDGIGAGPSMDVTSNLVRTINSLVFNDRIMIGTSPAVQSLYPTQTVEYFEELVKKSGGLPEDESANLEKLRNTPSVYPPLESYLEASNKLSRKVLSNWFVTQTKPFKDVVFTIGGQINGSELRSLTEDQIKNINKFLSINILRGFKSFGGLNPAQVLGVGKEVVTEASDVDIEAFSSLSTAEKILVMKNKYKDKLLVEPQHILNFLTPVLDQDIVKEKGYHDINFTFYKNEFTDDNLADSISAMYESGDEFERELANSLINYAFVANGLTYGLRSYSKVIPSEVLHKIGIGDYLRERQIDLNQGITGFDNETIELFYRNNWGNSDFVPVVKTRWDLVKDAQGRRTVRRTEEGYALTKNGTPRWDATQSFLRISKKSLINMPEKVKLAPFVSIWTETGLKLYKRYTETIIDEAGNTKEIDTFLGDHYYYQVNKLGKDGINEFERISMFPENNAAKGEAEVIMDIRTTIAGLKKQKNAPKTDNTSREDKDDIINKCNIK